MHEMGVSYLIVAALGLSMDTFAVATAIGIGYRPITARTVFRVVWHFTLFQVALFAFGWWTGGVLERYFGAYDHWLAAGLLWVIAAHMMIQWWQDQPPEYRSDPSRGTSLIMLSTATSMDALALGASFGLLNAPVELAGAILAVTTALLAGIGLAFGRSLGKILGRWAMLAGGIALFALGIRILIAHLSGA